MAGVPGMETKNMTGAGLKALSSLQVKQWPWESRNVDPEKWDQQRIFRYLSRKLEERGVTRDRSASDLVGHLATHHWLCMKAWEAIRNGDTLSGKNPYSVLDSSRSRILGAWRGLGVFPYGSVQERKGDDNEGVPDFS